MSSELFRARARAWFLGSYCTCGSVLIVIPHERPEWRIVCARKHAERDPEPPL